MYPVTVIRNLLTPPRSIDLGADRMSKGKIRKIVEEMMRKLRLELSLAETMIIPIIAIHVCVNSSWRHK